VRAALAADHLKLPAGPSIGRCGLTDASCPSRFSAVAPDRSAEPPALVTVEYQTDLTGRIARRPVDLASTELVSHGGADMSLRTGDAAPASRRAAWGESDERHPRTEPDQGLKPPQHEDLKSWSFLWQKFSAFSSHHSSE
jgi:hypothetical protein